ncbi:hypothetical protein PR048_001575 [Dryococelus australis]|uniref:CHK kinase-like domain-containing protein n=1 Tax=Dryococelus australis TaxID=614101 RepID=A0ABQ9IHT8_9NEOP|nr:hypothetical protein PR048_001575 [Dryococelus australis]
MGSTAVFSDDVKGDVSWLDDTFVKKVLQRMNGDTEVSVLHLHIAMATLPGENYFSLMYRVHVEFSRGGEPMESMFFIVKTLPESEVVQKMVLNCGIFSRETSVYSSLLPALLALLDNRAPGCFPQFAAKGLYYEVSPVHLLAMEDLKASGFSTACRQQGLDLTHCRLVMETLGRFHGASAVLSMCQPGIVAPFLFNPFTITDNGELHRLVVNTVSALSTEVERWAGYEACGRKLGRLSGKFFKKVVHAMSRDESSRSSFSVINHLDLWVNNIMFSYSGGQPAAVRFVDFQMPYVTSPVIDLLYFLYTSPSPEVRAAHKDDLLTWYHASLSDTLHKLGHPAPYPTLQELLNEMERREFYGLFAACSILPFVLCRLGHVPAMQDVIADTPTIDMHAFYSHDYIIEIKKMLQVFDAKGFLD